MKDKQLLTVYVMFMTIKSEHINCVSLYVIFIHLFCSYKYNRCTNKFMLWSHTEHKWLCRYLVGLMGWGRVGGVVGQENKFGWRNNDKEYIFM